MRECTPKTEAKSFSLSLSHTHCGASDALSASSTSSSPPYVFSLRCFQNYAHKFLSSATRICLLLSCIRVQFVFPLPCIGVTSQCLHFNTNYRPQNYCLRTAAFHFQGSNPPNTDMCQLTPCAFLKTTHPWTLADAFTTLFHLRGATLLTSTPHVPYLLLVLLRFPLFFLPTFSLSL